MFLVRSGDPLLAVEIGNDDDDDDDDGDVADVDGEYFRDCSVLLFFFLISLQSCVDSLRDLWPLKQNLAMTNSSSGSR